MIWFTADTHFGHENLALGKRTQFKNIEEMNETIINNWNEVIKSGDIVYVLGDFAVGSKDFIRKIRHRLHGKINLALGNHDYRNRIHNMPELFSSMFDLKTVRINKQLVVLCHYCMERWDESYYGSWHLFGHSHNEFHPDGKRFDVGVDSNNYRLISWDEVVEKMKSRPYANDYIDRSTQLVRM